MTAALSAYPTSLVQAFKNIAVVDPKSGLLTPTGIQVMKGIVDFINTMNRIIPCNCSTTVSKLTLTQFAPGPFLAQYNDYDAYVFVADASVPTAVTASVTTSATPSQTFATIKVYTSPGLVQATAGDVVLGGLYVAFFNDALDSGNGGLVLK